MKWKGNKEKAEIKQEIAKHLSLNGPNGWDALLAGRPSMSRATMYRYIKEVREEMEDDASNTPGADIKAMQRRIRAKTDSPERMEKQMKTHMPVTPSPAVLLGLGKSADDVFSFIGCFNQLMADSHMLRSAAVSTNDDGTEKLKNPSLMDKSICRRLDLMETWLKSQDMIWNIEKIQDLYHLIIDEVGKVDAHTQQAILTRIRALNNKRGMTIDANLM